MNAAISHMVSMNFEALLRCVLTHAKVGIDKLPINSKSTQGKISEEKSFTPFSVDDVAFIAQICSIKSQDETLLQISPVRRLSVR